MLSPTKAIVILLFSAVQYVSLFKFNDPEEPGVVFEPDSKTESQLLYVDENNDGSEVTLVLITDVEASLDFDIQSGEEDGLDPKLEKIDDSSYYLKGVRLDYERIKTKSILLEIFEVNITNSSKFLNIHIVNIDDESPSLTVSLCEMDEETVINIENSKCIFQVSDPDGWLQYMTFDIIGHSNENELFQFAYKDTPDNNTYQADIFLVLQDNQTLDYEKIFIYTFIVEAKDSAEHTTIPVANISVVVEVDDIPDQPPMWTLIPSVEKITEKAVATLQVSARDGDFGINNEINYRIEDDKTGLIHIDTTTGEISIDPIDRDAGNDEVVFNVTAFEKVDETSTATAAITLFVIDIDDHIPEITVGKETIEEFVIEVDEGSVNITDRVFDVSDIDLGDNAVYTIQLRTLGDVDFTTAFELSSMTGYQNTSLGLTAIYPQKLDYEDESWKIIAMELYTEGTKNPSNHYNLSIKINLKDINDEPPIFDHDEYFVAVKESVPKGTVIANIQATDLDAEDIEKGVLHTLLGIFNETLQIEQFGGAVTTIVDNAFDYEKEKEVDILIQAEDAVGHTAITQLIVQVIDVNDEPPVLTVTPVQITIEENQQDGTVLDVLIEAVDVDTTAELEFSINWDNSYATKSSIELNQEDFEQFYNCIEVETVSPDDDNNKASAKLSIKEVILDNTPDFEIFDTLFLVIVVTDKATEINDPADSDILVIEILNLNDNSPQFSEETTSIQNTVVENSKNGTIVGVVTATDLDGDTLTYSIMASDDDTPLWVDINHETGILYVNLQNDDLIDCDDPARYSLTYNVSVFDGNFDVFTTITVNILDTNDNAPQLDNLELNEYEDFGNNSSHGGLTLSVFDLMDIDRDDPFHTVNCTFMPNETDEIVLQTFFIEKNKLKVHDGVVLDRELYPEYTIILYCYDDPTHTGPISNPIVPPPEIIVRLLDVNDNYPEIINTDAIKINENDSKGDTSQKLIGKDDDTGANGMINFDLISISRFLDIDHTNKVENVSQTLFAVNSDAIHKEATLSIKEDLKGSYGYFELLVTTTDLGEPPLSKNNTVNLEVTRYNFKEPIFTFPRDRTTYILDLKESQTQNKLILNDGTEFEKVQANDNGQDKYNITFSLYTDSDEDSILVLKDLGNSEAEIGIKKDIANIADKYDVTITAYLDTDDTPINDEAPYTNNCKITFQFDNDKKL